MNMKKKMLFMIAILFIGIITVNAKTINGDVVIYWFDYDNYYNERPSSITLPMYDDNDVDRETKTITIDESDVKVTRVNEYLTTWTYNLSFESIKENPYYVFSAKSFSIPTGYEFDTGHSSGGFSYDNGSAEIYLYKNTMVTSTITINYHDDDCRDYGMRGLEFYITATNGNYEETFEYGKGSKYYSANTFTDEVIIQGVVNDDMTSENYMDPMEYEVVDTVKYENREVTYTWDGYDLNIDVYYTASKTTLPIKVKWDDENNKNNARPSEITVKAYDQNNNLEKEITITEDNWETLEEVFLNMKFSNGTKIEYTLEVENTDNYTYTVTKENDEYIITGTYKEEVTEIIENPNTIDNLPIYIASFIASLSLLIYLTIKNKISKTL